MSHRHEELVRAPSMMMEPPLDSYRRHTISSLAKVQMVCKQINEKNAQSSIRRGGTRSGEESGRRRDFE